MKSDNFQNSPKSAVEKIIDMIPTSADFAMVLTFNKGQKKEEAIDKILYALNVIEPEYAHRMPLANNSTILILLGNGLCEEKTRRDSTLKIYEILKKVFSDYVSNGSINVQLYIDVDFYDEIDNTELEAKRCVFVQNITSANPLNESFNDALLDDNRFGNEDLKIVTTRV